MKKIYHLSIYYPCICIIYHLYIIHLSTYYLCLYYLLSIYCPCSYVSAQRDTQSMCLCQTLLSKHYFN